jgi:putative transposase
MEVIRCVSVCLHAYDSASDARTGIARYIEFYNTRRPHLSLDGATPDSVYFNPLLLPMAAQPAGPDLALTKNCPNQRAHL